MCVFFGFGYVIKRLEHEICIPFLLVVWWPLPKDLVGLEGVVVFDTSNSLLVAKYSNTCDSLPVYKKLIIMHANVINITITVLMVCHSMYKHSWSSCNLQILVLSILLRYISNCQFSTSSYSLPWNHGAEIYYITLLINSRLWDMGYNNR